LLDSSANGSGIRKQATAAIMGDAGHEYDENDDSCIGSTDSVAKIKTVPVAATAVAAYGGKQHQQPESTSNNHDNNKSWSSCQIPSHLAQIVHVCANHKKPRKLITTIQKEIDIHRKAIITLNADHDNDQSCLGIIFFAKIKTLKYMSQLLRQEQKQLKGLGGVWELHSQLGQGIREASLDAFQNSASTKGWRRSAEQSPSKRQRRNGNGASSSSSSAGRRRGSDGGGGGGEYGGCSLLLATDLAARGLDIANIRFVIQYDFPGNLETYVHRCGRAGRDAQAARIYSFFTRNLGPAMAASVVQLLRQGGVRGGKAQWVDPNLQELAVAAPASASTNATMESSLPRAVNRSTSSKDVSNGRQGQQSQSQIQKKIDSHSAKSHESSNIKNNSHYNDNVGEENDDAFADLSGSRIVLQRSSHVSDPSDDEDDDDDDYN
jgi:superfamily II DNA/RNA helicase